MNWAQLQAILWLRWRLTRNQFSRGGQLNTVLSVLLLLFMVLAGCALAVATFFVGFFLQRQPPLVVLLVWDAAIFLFLVVWFSGLMVEIQRSESIDITRLLHLPVTLQQVFVFNYIAAHFTPAIVVMVPAMLGLCVGLTAGGEPGMALMVPLVMAFVFAITAWTYCLRGWLAALMTNKRRRRTIMVWAVLFFVCIGQLPNLLINSGLFRHERRDDRARQAEGKSRDLVLPEMVMQAHWVVPFGWPGYGAMQLKQGDGGTALLLTASALLIGILGLTRAYQMTLQFYRGAERRTAIVPIASPGTVSPTSSSSRGPLLVERRLPWLPEDTAALTLATFRSLTRAPELKMALLIPIIMCIAIGGVRFGRHGSTRTPPEMVLLFAATGVVAGVAFALAPTMSNLFGLDRNAFRGLLLSPMRREKILFAKNLAFLPFALGTTLVILLLVKWVLHVPWIVILVGVLQMLTAFLLSSPLCNCFSILLPYRLAEGTLKAQKPKALVFVAAFGVMLITPVMLVPIVIPPVLQAVFMANDWLPWLPVNLLAALVILAGTMGLYRSLLPAQGRLLQRREQAILREVTTETE